MVEINLLERVNAGGCEDAGFLTWPLECMDWDVVITNQRRWFLTDRVFETPLGGTWCHLSYLLETVDSGFTSRLGSEDFKGDFGDWLLGFLSEEGKLKFKLFF